MKYGEGSEGEEGGGGGRKRNSLLSHIKRIKLHYTLWNKTDVVKCLK